MKRMIQTDQCSGYLPGTKSIPWSNTVASGRTFESADELQTIYPEQKSIDPNQPTIAYCIVPGMHQIVE